MAEHAAMALPAPERFDGAAAWAGLPAETQAAIGAIALELVCTEVLSDRAMEDDLPDTFERIADAAYRELSRDLRALVEEALPDGAFEGAEGGTPRIPALLGGVCRVCACSQNDACPGGCGWAEEDLCTACVTGEAHADG